MKVLQVHNRYRDPGGEDTVVRAEAELLRRSGHEVVTYTADNPSGRAGAAAALSVAAWNPKAAAAVRKYATRMAPDVAHVHNTWFALSPAVVAALADAGIPVAMTLHNYRLACANALLFRDGRPCELCVGSSPWPGVRHRCYRGSAVASVAAASTIAINRARHTWRNNVNVFVALTRFAKSRFVAAGLPDDRIVVKPHFVFDPGPRPSPPSESNVVLFVGRLSPEKGLLTLMRAWRKAALPDLVLRVIGEGPLRAALTEEHGDAVEVIGGVAADRVQREMLSARALVFPSEWYETQGMVLLEAFSAGLPVLSSDLGAAGEVTESLDRTWRREPGNVDAWAEGLQSLLDGEAVDAAGAQVRAMWTDRYSPQVALHGLERIYERAGSHR